MLHTVKTDRGEPISWRDPTDIRTELRTLSASLSTARERYAALEVARDLLRSYRRDEATSEAFDALLESARATLGELGEGAERLAELQKEMRDTLCLMQRI